MTHDELKKNTARVLPPSGYSEKISWIIASEVPLASVAVTPISLGDAHSFHTARKKLEAQCASSILKVMFPNEFLDFPVSITFHPCPFTYISRIIQIATYLLWFIHPKDEKLHQVLLRQHGSVELSDSIVNACEEDCTVHF